MNKVKMISQNVLQNELNFSKTQQYKITFILYLYFYLEFKEIVIKIFKKKMNYDHPSTG